MAAKDSQGGPSQREEQLLTQLTEAKERFRNSRSEADKTKKIEIAEKLRELRSKDRQGRTSMVGGDAYVVGA